MPFWELLLRLTVAVLCGGLLGMNRQWLGKPAGLRTHIMVTLGSAAFVLLMFEAWEKLPIKVAETFPELSRVVQGLAGGLGFIGAGCIIQGRGKVLGLTTAASVWVSGAIGTACGVGAYRTALTATVFGFITLSALGRAESRIERRAPAGPDKRVEPKPAGDDSHR